MSKTVLFVYGTRPEAIKMAPVVLEMRKHPELTPVVAVTGQHRRILDQVNSVFGIEPDFDLDMMTQGQTLAGITTKTLNGLEPILRSVEPAAVCVQGDTTTCFAGALAAFYHQISVAHLEAGLRTDTKYNPFPEELNRRLTTQLADLHLAPTTVARDNLIRESVAASAIVVTGNTVIDALLATTAAPRTIEHAELSQFLNATTGRPLLLVTSHRRESWGEAMRRTATAIAELASTFPRLRVVVPAHPNPIVQDALRPPLSGLTNVLIIDALDYADFCQVMKQATVVLTDSGGVQEEAPSLGKPVLVLRETTERPEAVAAGSAMLVGTDTSRIVAEVSRLLTDPVHYDNMARARNPYGDGQAARRAVTAMAHFLGLGPMAEEFTS